MKTDAESIEKDKEIVENKDKIRSLIIDKISLNTFIQL
jgi:hypothetical protein